MPRPEQGTPEWDLWVAALEVAAYPPLKPTRPTVYLYIDRLQALRDALDALGVDWRKAKADVEEARRERRGVNT